MSYGTRHIREMLAQAIDACEKADKIVADHPHGLGSAMEPEVLRLLKGANINAIHAYSEIRDEMFRLQYGDDGYLR